MKQDKINKILIIILIALVAFIGYYRITEKERIRYYICYERMVDNYGSPDEDTIIRIEESCKWQLEERND